MGAFRIVIEGVGAHGDDRVAKEGQRITLPYRNTPDGIAADAVERLARCCVVDLKATLTHWPGETTEVIDALVAMVRVKGTF